MRFHKCWKLPKPFKGGGESIISLFDNNDVGIFSKDEDQSIKVLETKKKELPDTEEITWRLKSKSIWIKEGDNNTKFIPLLW